MGETKLGNGDRRRGHGELKIQIRSFTVKGFNIPRTVSSDCGSAIFGRSHWLPLCRVRERVHRVESLTSSSGIYEYIIDSNLR